MEIKSFVLLFGIVFLFGFVLASAGPPGGPPKVFSGNVYVNGTLLSTGTYTLTAWIGNSAVAQTTVSNGHYSNLQISTLSTGTITFIVNGVQANETSTWNNNRDTDWGQNVVLDLDLNLRPSATSLCGNNVVDLGEECDGLNLAGRSTTDCGTGWTGTISCSATCVIDYSNCTQIPSATNSGGSNSGSSSGGGSSGGGAGAGPSVISAAYPNNESGNSSNGTTSLSNGNSPENSGGITGAVIGAIGVPGFATLLVALVAVIALIVVFNMRKKKGGNIRKKVKEILKGK